MAEGGRRQRTVAAVSDGTLMSVAAWCKTLTPTAEEAAITLDSLMARTSFDAPDEPGEVPAFIGSSPASSDWVRTDRPEEAAAAPPSRPTRPARPAAPAALPNKSWMGSEKMFPLNADQQAVLDTAKAQLKEAGVELPDALLAAFVIVKKTASAVVTTSQTYKKWINMLDYETLGWDRIERELNRGVYLMPNKPFAHGQNDSVCLYINTNAFDARTGSRNIVATLWLLVHYLLAKSDTGLHNGATVVLQGNGISYSKFYPAVQRCLFDSMQSVLPLRVAGMNVVDPPYIFQMLWGIVSAWLSEKLRNRVFVLSSSNIGKHFDKSQVPTWLKGDLAWGAGEQSAWVAEMKSFYEKDFLPAITPLADNPDGQKHPELWEPAGRK
jgi:uncharacterized lipoprotein YmbA